MEGEAALTPERLSSKVRVNGSVQTSQTESQRQTETTNRPKEAETSRKHLSVHSYADWLQDFIFYLQTMTFSSSLCWWNNTYSLLTPPLYICFPLWPHPFLLETRDRDEIETINSWKNLLRRRRREIYDRLIYNQRSCPLLEGWENKGLKHRSLFLMASFLKGHTKISKLKEHYVKWFMFWPVFDWFNTCSMQSSHSAESGPLNPAPDAQCFNYNHKFSSKSHHVSVMVQFWPLVVPGAPYLGWGVLWVSVRSFLRNELSQQWCLPSLSLHAACLNSLCRYSSFLSVFLCWNEVLESNDALFG